MPEYSFAKIFYFFLFLIVILSRYKVSNGISEITRPKANILAVDMENNLTMIETVPVFKLLLIDSSLRNFGSKGCFVDHPQSTPAKALLNPAQILRV